MTYALDTNIISFILRKDPGLRARIEALDGANDRAIVPLIVYYEVKRGLLYKGAMVKLTAFERLCAKLGVEDMTAADVDTASRIHAWRKQHGRPVGDSDILIAAQCITRGYTLVTNYTKDFIDAGEVGKLALEDWTE